MSKDAPKSAVELALERFASTEGQTGDAMTLTDEQKAAIAKVRRDYEANVAEAEILFHSKLVATFDSDARQQLEANHRRDLGQFASSCERKVDAIRQGGSL
jgi:hypothetical protein